MSELTFLERLVLRKIKDKENILMIPIDIFTSILHYSELNEDYETCAYLMSLIERVSFKTTFMFYDDFIDQDKTLKLLPHGKR